MFFLLVQVHCIIQLSQLIFVPDTLYLKSNLNVKAYAHFEFLQCIKGGVNANLADRKDANCYQEKNESKFKSTRIEYFHLLFGSIYFMNMIYARKYNQYKRVISTWQSLLTN